MPKPTMNRKAEMLKEANKSSRKAYGYAVDARLSKASEKAANETGYPANRYKADKDAANAMANMYESEAEVLRQRASNSREQYEHERKAGDPNALNLSFKEWQKL